MVLRDDQKDQVQQATDIVRLIGEQVSLRPKGREFAGLCPFHEDKNPSMFVSPAKQIYKCFACGAGGDAFSFVINYHKMTFPEALRYLADRAGITLKKTFRGAGAGSEDGEGLSDRQRIAAVNVQAVEFFRALYRHPEHGRAAREYADRRGISPAMIDAFQLGYASDRWDGLALTIGQKGWDRQGFILAGLVSPRQRDGASANSQDCYDRLRHRLIFPIFDAIGRPIAFGGRKLREEDEPKYLNSPETALFNKSATLYGLHLAKKPIIDSRTAVVVEGYTDVIACHQALPEGTANVVATLGTALTAEHVAELRRYAEKVVLVFDADAAGQKAADRAVELFLTGDLDVAIAVLPSHEGVKLDPADLMAQEDGPAVWQQIVEEAQDALAYQFDRVRQRLADTDTVTGRQKIGEAYLTQIAQLGFSRTGTIRRALVVQRLAELLRMSEPVVSDMLQEAAARNAPRNLPRNAPHAAQPSGPEGFAPSAFVDAPASTWGVDEDNVRADVAPSQPRHRLKAVRLAERQLIGCLIQRNELFHYTLPDGRTLDEALPPGEIQSPAEHRLYQRVYDWLCESEGLTLASLLGDLASRHEQDLSSLATEADAAVDRATQGKADNLEPVFLAAVEAVLAQHREQNYRLTRAVIDQVDGVDEKAAQAERLRAALRENPSPIRIARFRG